MTSRPRMDVFDTCISYERNTAKNLVRKQDCQKLLPVPPPHRLPRVIVGKVACALIAMATAAIKVIKDPKSRINSHGNSVRCVCYSPDGEQFATASSDKVVKCFSNEGRELFK